MIWHASSKCSLNLLKSSSDLFGFGGCWIWCLYQVCSLVCKNCRSRVLINIMWGLDSWFYFCFSWVRLGTIWRCSKLGVKSVQLGRFEVRFFHRTKIFDFTKFGTDTKPYGRNTDTELTGFQLVWFDQLSIASNFLETQQIKEKKGLFPFAFDTQIPSKKNK